MRAQAPDGYRHESVAVEPELLARRLLEPGVKRSRATPALHVDDHGCT